jgi:flagellar protein FlgJ
MTDAITIRGAAPAPADAAKAAVERKKKVEAIRGFEEMFLTEMMKSMRKTVPEGEEGGNAKGIWKERFDAEIAHRIAESGGIGLAKMLEQGLAAPTGRK